MLKIDFTRDIVFSFDGPNLCFLGSEGDFMRLAKSVTVLTSVGSINTVEVTSQEYVQLVGEDIKVIFKAKPGSSVFGKIIKEEGIVLFELDDRYWERLFVFFALMSWDKKTFYLNSFEEALRDLPLDQEVHFICSSEW